MIRADAPFVVFDEIDSTNEEARRRAAGAEREPAWLLAMRQTAGRGRMGRAWLTLPGNLFLTYYGLSTRPAADVALLGFAAGLALAETCEPLVGGGVVSLKWPNDLLLAGRKAAGILLESGPFGPGEGGELWFAIGVGLNIARAPADAGQPTAALSDFIAEAPAPVRLAQDFAARLASWAGRIEREGFAPARAAWAARAHGLGAPVRVQLGAAAIEGIARGLSPRGELVLALASGETRLISAGDVYFPASVSAP